MDLPFQWVNQQHPLLNWLTGHKPDKYEITSEHNFTPLSSIYLYLVMQIRCISYASV